MTATKDEAVPDPHFGTQHGTILAIWDRMQRIQTDFAIAQELGFYYTSPQWLRARTVLDIGCGNGYYLHQLAARFPDKAYTGIDISPELIAVAEREVLAPNITVERGDPVSHGGTYDFVVMRLLLQHLDDVPDVLDRVAQLVAPGGSALIVDANDRVRAFHPPLPQFVDFFAAYAERERGAGRDRDVVGRLARALSTSTSWRRGDTLELLIPSTIDGNRELFTETYSLLIDLVREVGELDYAFDDVARAWSNWCRLSNAYAQVGLNLVRIDRV
jgi:SAM-dependent methyltransferase